MPRSFLLLPCALLSFALAACGSTVQEGGAGGSAGASSTTGGKTTGTTGTGTTSTTTGAGGSAGGTTSSTVTGSTGGSAGAGGSGGGSGCPATEPAQGDPCPALGLSCEYGADPRISCRDRAVCMTVDGPRTWSIMQPELCPPLPMGMCPATPTASGACEPSGLICLYPSGAECDCTSCGGAPCNLNPTWNCASPPNAGCPPTAPLAGHPCGDPGLSCQYGTCGVATLSQRVCTGGVWVDMPLACGL